MTDKEKSSAPASSAAAPAKRKAPAAPAAPALPKSSATKEELARIAACEQEIALTQPAYEAACHVRSGIRHRYANTMAPHKRQLASLLKVVATRDAEAAKKLAPKR